MSENVPSLDDFRNPNNKYFIEEYKELHNNRRSHGDHFLKAITWSTAACLLIYKTIIDNKIPPLSLCLIPVIAILLTVTICMRHQQRLKAIDKRVGELEKHFEFKAKKYYDECVSKRWGVTNTLMVLLTLTHLMLIIYGALIFFGRLDDYRNAPSPSFW